MIPHLFSKTGINTRIWKEDTPTKIALLPWEGNLLSSDSPLEDKEGGRA